MFAVEPVLGRLFTSDEMKARSGGALLISHAYWQSRFGGDPGALARTVRIYGRAVQIAGVLPPGFHFPGNTDLWIPADTITRETGQYRSGNNYLAVGRLQRDASLERAKAEMASIAARLAEQYPDSNKGRSVAVARMRDDMVGDIRLTLYLLWGAVGVVLLIACANTATLLSGQGDESHARDCGSRCARRQPPPHRASGHHRKPASCAASARSWACFSPCSTSSVLVDWAPASVPRIAETGIDGRVLVFTLGVAVLTS